MNPAEKTLILQSPTSPSEWDAYFDLRWRILRQPWSQPRGSERDAMDDTAFHLLLLDIAGTALACGRLHFNAPDEAQVRFMAVSENVHGRGYGHRILQALEAEAARRGARKIVLNARDNVTEFYTKRGYAVIGEGETLFGVIRHVRMEKSLS
jgi:N-acetylglutamate synthase-like GNAT family acetyltransferase